MKSKKPIIKHINDESTTLISLDADVKCFSLHFFVYHKHVKHPIIDLDEIKPQASSLQSSAIL